MASSRFSVSDALWSRFQPCMTPRVNTHRFGGGRPRRDDRSCLDGIFFVLRTGCQWKALDATGICPGSTAHDRFARWCEDGTFERFFHAGLLDYDELVGIDWSFLAMDGAMTKAPLGGKGHRQEPHRPGQARGQTQPAGRGRGRAAGGGGRRGQPARHEPLRADARRTRAAADRAS
jgi:transposase